MPFVTLPSNDEYEVRILLGKGDSNAKLTKSDMSDNGYLTVGLSLSPANESGYQVCTDSSKGCREACLFFAGQGAFQTVKNARMAKTILFFEQRKTFLDMLIKELESHVKRAKKQGKKLACRLNMLSDIMWEKVWENLFWHFPNVQFYDYTKHYKRMLKYLNGDLPTNYHLTFSRSETNGQLAKNVLDKGGNVATVFDGELPTHWCAYDVINGDETDLRFLDDKNVVVGLKAKGRAKKDTSGFVVNSRVSLPVLA